MNGNDYQESWPGPINITVFGPVHNITRRSSVIKSFCMSCKIAFETPGSNPHCLSISVYLTINSLFGIQLLPGFLSQLHNIGTTSSGSDKRCDWLSTIFVVSIFLRMASTVMKIRTGTAAVMTKIKTQSHPARVKVWSAFSQVLNIFHAVPKPKKVASQVIHLHRFSFSCLIAQFFNFVFISMISNSIALQNIL